MSLVDIGVVLFGMFIFTVIIDAVSEGLLNVYI